MGEDDIEVDIGVPRTKRGQQREHARERALERYGVTLTGEALADMRAQIREDRAVLVEMRSKTFGIFLVYWADAQRIVPVFYSSARRQITSVLPPSPFHRPRHASESADAVGNAPSLCKNPPSPGSSPLCRDRY